VASQYVRVASVNTLHIDSLDNDGNFKTSLYGSTLPALGSGSNGGAFSGGIADTNRPGLYFENITTSNIQGFSPDDYVPAFNLLSDRDSYDFTDLFTPGLVVSNEAVSVSSVTGDSITVCDVSLYGDSIAQAVARAGSVNTSYGVGYYPWVQVFSNTLGKLVWTPPSVVIAGVYAFNDSVGASWFSPAGLGRGGLNVSRFERKITATQKAELYSNNINPLIDFPNEGPVVWGNKTFERKQTATSRVNVRRLANDLKRYLTAVSKQFIFENNTAANRNRLLAILNPYFEQVVQRQGLYGFEIIISDEINTPDSIDRNELNGVVSIRPTKAIEFIKFEFNIDPTGATVN
jgi:phage tail sheath protein FI